VLLRDHRAQISLDVENAEAGGSSNKTHSMRIDVWITRLQPESNKGEQDFAGMLWSVLECSTDASRGSASFETRRSRRAESSSASLGLTDFSQVDMLGVRYKSVHFGAEKSPGESVSPNRLRQS
jgi:hypothetical protein